MKTQRFIYLITFILLSSCAIVKKDFEIHRKAAFCTCLSENMRKVDSTYAKNNLDVSTSTLLMETDVNHLVFRDVVSFADSTTQNYYRYTSHTTSQSADNWHIISLSCLEFYDSKLLKAEIKRLMRKDQKEER